MDVIDFAPGKFLVASLPSNQIPADEQAEENKTSSTTPVDDGISKKEVLRDMIVPAAHPEADVQDGPLPELRCEIVLLVGIWDQGVVRGHHRNIKMHKVS